MHNKVKMVDPVHLPLFAALITSLLVAGKQNLRAASQLLAEMLSVDTPADTPFTVKERGNIKSGERAARSCLICDRSQPVLMEQRGHRSCCGRDMRNGVSGQGKPRPYTTNLSNAGESSKRRWIRTIWSAVQTA